MVLLILLLILLFRIHPIKDLKNLLSKQNKCYIILMKSKLRPNTLAEQMKIKKFNPIELKAWNSLYPDIKFKQKKVNCP